MTISKIADRGSVANTTASLTTAVDMAAAGSILKGNLLVARVACDNSGASGAATTLSVSDPRGNTWTVLGPANQDPGAASAGATCYIAYAPITVALVDGDDVTFTYGNSTTADSIVIEEWQGVHWISPVAVAVTTANNAGGGGTGTPPSIARTPTAASQLFYGALATEGPSTDTYTEDSDSTNGSWVSLTRTGGNSGTATNDMTVAGGYKIVNASGAQTWNPTIGTNRDWAQLALVFDAAPAMSTHVDNFDDNSINATLWANNFGTVAESSGRAVVNCDAGSGYLSRAAYVFDSLYARVVPAPPLNESSFIYTAMSVNPSTNASNTDMIILCDTLNNQITFTTRTAGSNDAGSATITYDSVAHAWWRIRRSGANILFETSPDGSTWTQRNSQAAPGYADVGNFWLNLQAGRGNGTTNTTEFDNCNVPPTALIPADTRRQYLRPLLVR